MNRPRSHLCVIVLLALGNDEREQAVQIFRTVGRAQPSDLGDEVRGWDRIVMGLNGASQDPILVLYSVDGAEQSAVGHD
jgi:hypothetical protein